MSMPLSLFEELTASKFQDKVPVTLTGPLSQLIEVVGYDVCLVSRNRHRSYWIVSSARDICDSVNNFFTRPDLRTAAGKGNPWDDIFEQTDRIGELESILLEFSRHAEAEATVTMLACSNAIQDDLTFIEAWRINRAGVNEATNRIFKCLYPESAPADPRARAEVEIKAIRKHDDNAIFSAISSSLSSITAVTDQSFLSIRGQLDTLWNKLLSGNYHDDLVVYATQTAMTLEAVLSKRDRETSERLLSSNTELWTKATSLIEKIMEHTTDSALSLEELGAAWLNFCAYLKPELPDVYENLRLWVPQIKRPYMMQSLVLISACVKVALAFNKTKTAAMLTPLTLAIEATTTALNSVTTIVYEPRQEFSPEESTTDKLTAAAVAIKNCFNHYTTASPEFDGNAETFDRELTEAGQIDKERVAALQKKLVPARQRPQSANLVQLRVTRIIGAGASAERTETTYSVEPGTALDSILWREIRSVEEGQREELREKGVFRGTENAEDALSLDTKVTELVEEQNQRTVFLVVVPQRDHGGAANTADKSESNNGGDAKGGGQSSAGESRNEEGGGENGEGDHGGGGEEQSSAGESRNKEGGGESGESDHSAGGGIGGGGEGQN